MSTGTKRRAQEARERAAAARRETQDREQRRTRLRRAALVLTIVAIAGAIVGLALAGGDDTSPSQGAIDTGQAATSGTAMPPWLAPPDTPSRAEAAGLSLGPMGTAQHYHVHLDVIADGLPIPVAKDIGVDPRSGVMSGLHTHDTTGLIHIEAARADQRFTLGQLFTEWNVRLTPKQVGGLRDSAAKTWRIYVNGKQFTTNPAALVLRPHQEIALVYGSPTADVKVPSNYDFNGQ